MHALMKNQNKESGKIRPIFLVAILYGVSWKSFWCMLKGTCGFELHAKIFETVFKFSLLSMGKMGLGFLVDQICLVGSRNYDPNVKNLRFSGFSLPLPPCCFQQLLKLFNFLQKLLLFIRLMQIKKISLWANFFSLGCNLKGAMVLKFCFGAVKIFVLSAVLPPLHGYGTNLYVLQHCASFFFGPWKHNSSPQYLAPFFFQWPNFS